MWKFVSLVCFLLFAAPAGATDYYVDATGGNDSWDGLTEPNAWATIDKVNGASFSPGDNIYFKRGEKWREELEPPDAGDPNDGQITFGAYGSNATDPIISGADVFRSWTADAPSYKATATVEPTIVVYNDVILTEDNEKFEVLDSSEWDHDPNTDTLWVNVGEDPNEGTLEASVRPFAVDTDTGNPDYLTFTNLILEYAAESNMRLDASDYVIVDGIETRNTAGSGVYLMYSDYVTIRNSTFHGMGSISTVADEAGGGWGSGITSWSSDITVNNATIEDNEFYNYIGNNVGDHGLYIGGNDAVVRYNYFHEFGGSTIKFVGQDDTAYYNIAVNPAYKCNSAQQSTSGRPELTNLKFHHMTCAYWGAGTIQNSLLWVADEITVLGASVDLLNNIALGDPNMSTNMYRVDGGDLSLFDYNYNIGHDIADYWMHGPTGQQRQTIEDFRGASIHDANSMETDPYLTDPNSGDITGVIPRRDSPAIYAGTPLGYTRDYFGAAIRDPNHPTIGAVEVWPKVW